MATWKMVNSNTGSQVQEVRCFSFVFIVIYSVTKIVDTPKLNGIP